MDDERRNDVGGGIVVGCLALGLLMAVLMLGAAGLWFVRSVRIEEATVVEEPQVSAITEEEKEIPPEATPETELK